MFPSRNPLTHSTSIDFYYWSHGVYLSIWNEKVRWLGDLLGLPLGSTSKKILFLVLWLQADTLFHSYGTVYQRVIVLNLSQARPNISRLRATDPRFSNDLLSAVFHLGIVKSCEICNLPDFLTLQFYWRLQHNLNLYEFQHVSWGLRNNLLSPEMAHDGTGNRSRICSMYESTNIHPTMERSNP